MTTPSARGRGRVPLQVCWLAAAAVSALAGCGGGGGGGGAPPPAVSVALSPAAVELAPAQTATFSAAVSGTNNQQVVWGVLEGLAGGTVSDAGVYTAPGLAGTFHVVATSWADLTKNAVATVTVRLSVAVTPAAATLTLREARQLNAAVAGSANQGVTWAVQEGAAGGSVSAGGLYTAPSAPGTYHVVATSQADPQQSATATITVVAGNVTVGVDFPPTGDANVIID